MEQPLLAIAAALRSGALSPYEYLDELESQFARREPAVLAFVDEADRFGRLRQEAAALLARYPEPAARPVLFGVPVAVKDIFHVAGMATRAGSRLPAEALAGPEADAVTRLKLAGALVLGKSVTTEFAYFAPGPTRNPHHPGHTPGGSSSGSAAAVGAGMAPLALGTQTIGSVNRPAAFCGVVGYKPSFNRLSKAGVIPVAPSLDHVGLFAAGAADVALAAGVLVTAWNPPRHLSRPVLGLPGKAYLERAGAEAQAHFAATVARLEAAGYLIRPVDILADMEALANRHLDLMAAEFARVHAGWYEAYGDRYHQRSRDLFERGRGVDDDTLAGLVSSRGALRARLSQAMRVNGIDLWLSPSATGVAPAGLDSTGDPIMNLPWTHAGLPTLTVLSGRDQQGLPYGLQLAGSWYGDEALLAWGQIIAAGPVAPGLQEN